MSVAETVESEDDISYLKDDEQWLRECDHADLQQGELDSLRHLLDEVKTQHEFINKRYINGLMKRRGMSKIFKVLSVATVVRCLILKVDTVRYLDREEFQQEVYRMRGISSNELRWLARYQRAMKIAVDNIEGNNKKQFLIDVCSFLEGSFVPQLRRPLQYITGSKASDATRRRVMIFEKVTGVLPIKRPERAAAKLSLLPEVASSQSTASAVPVAFSDGFLLPSLPQPASLPINVNGKIVNANGLIVMGNGNGIPVRKRRSTASDLNSHSHQDGSGGVAMKKARKSQRSAATVGMTAKKEVVVSTDEDESEEEDGSSLAATTGHQLFALCAAAHSQNDNHSQFTQNQNDREFVDEEEVVFPAVAEVPVQVQHSLNPNNNAHLYNPNYDNNLRRRGSLLDVLAQAVCSQDEPISSQLMDFDETNNNNDNDRNNSSNDNFDDIEMFRFSQSR
jgi:cyclophilin family peptidyl-prolyl cis-trans isomerase